MGDCLDELTYIGHGTTLIRIAELSILTDPMLRSWLGPLHRQGPPPDPAVTELCDLVLISHIHRDHLDVRSLRRVPPATPLIVPRGARKWAQRGGCEDIREIAVGETIAFGAVEVTAVRALHNGHRDRTWGKPIQPLGYLVTAAGRTVYFAGDTDLFPQMSELPPLDLALLPIWGWGSSVGEGHLDPARAVKALEMTRPRMAVPIHWGTFYPAGLRRWRPQPLIEPPQEFARLARPLAPAVEVRILPPGATTGLRS